jgi:hypothetical protein
MVLETYLCKVGFKDKFHSYYQCTCIAEHNRNNRLSNFWKTVWKFMDQHFSQTFLQISLDVLNSQFPI